MKEKIDPVLSKNLIIIKTKILYLISIIKLNYKILIGIIITLAITTTFIVYIFSQKKEIVQNLPSPTIIPTKYIISKQEPTPTPISIKASSLNMGNITWAEKSITLDPLSIFKKEQIGPDTIHDIKFQQDGISTNGYKIAKSIYTYTFGIGTTVFQRFIIDPKNDIYLLSDSSTNYWFGDFNNLPVVINDIPGIYSPEFLKIENGNFSRYDRWPTAKTFFSELKNQKLLANTEYGDLYTNIEKYTLTDEDGSVFQHPVGLYTRSFVLKLADGTFKSYYINIDFFKHTNNSYKNPVPTITWLDGTQNKDRYYFGPEIKCGPNTSHVYPNEYFSKSILVLAGHTLSGQDVFKITDKTNPVAVESYEQRNTYKNNDLLNTSIEDFLLQPSHFLWQDFMGDWHLFYSDKYFSNNYGCS